MILTHADIWRAIDRLAEQQHLSLAALARKAKLSTTIFNPSKRTAANGRPRWPSTESIAQILTATGTGMDGFLALARAKPGMAPPARLPLIGLAAAEKRDAFDRDGRPSGPAWDEMTLPLINDPRAFALEVTGKEYEPFYQDGDRLILAPEDALRRGDRAAARLDSGKIVLGRFQRESAQKIELRPFGARHDMAIAKSDVAWLCRIVWASQ
jgi:phage repressor protein C with HTH and peptisase S24 domain